MNVTVVSGHNIRLVVPIVCHHSASVEPEVDIWRNNGTRPRWRDHLNFNGELIGDEFVRVINLVHCAEHVFNVREHTIPSHQCNNSQNLHNWLQRINTRQGLARFALLPCARLPVGRTICASFPPWSNRENGKIKTVRFRMRGLAACFRKGETLISP